MIYIENQSIINSKKEEEEIAFVNSISANKVITKSLNMTLNKNTHISISLIDNRKDI